MAKEAVTKIKIRTATNVNQVSSKALRGIKGVGLVESRHAIAAIATLPTTYQETSGSIKLVLCISRIQVGIRRTTQLRTTRSPEVRPTPDHSSHV